MSRPSRPRWRASLTVLLVAGAGLLMAYTLPGLDRPVPAAEILGHPPDCPVTIPSNAFVPPEPWPAKPSSPDYIWYGTDDLWTVLEPDGDYVARKSVWWSANFPGGHEEGQPDVDVTWDRLGGSGRAVVDNGGKATNAYTDEDGWFMIAGIDPPKPGCWKVTATYKGAVLSYVYYRPPG